MGTDENADIVVGEIDRAFLGLHSEVRWSPRDRSYIAYCVEFPTLACTDPWSSLAAVDKLEGRIHDIMRAAAEFGPAR